MMGRRITRWIALTSPLKRFTSERERVEYPFASVPRGSKAPLGAGGWGSRKRGASG